MYDDPTQESFQDQEDFELPEGQDIDVKEETNHIVGGRGKETLFRVTFRNQINLISIADNKANMIISLNAILISLIIAVFGSGISIQGIPFMEKYILVVPFTILMITCLASAILAILSAKPHIIKTPEGINNPKLSLLFFGNFYMKTLNEYLEDMTSLLSSRDTIYEHLSIDIYNQGKILNRKYKLLGISYSIFMIGISLCVIAYFTIWIVWGF